MKIKRSDLSTVGIALLAFYAVMSITYLTMILHISSVVTFCIRLAIIGGFNFVMISRRRKFSKVYELLWAWWGVVFFSSLIHGCDLLYFLTLQSRVMAVCSLLEYFSKSPRKIRVVLHTWKNILLVLCVLDIVTIILFPGGLYAGDLYSEVWLLGYKTARLVYNLPLAIIICYLSYLDRKMISSEAMITVVFCVASCFMVNASGASLALLVYLFLIVYSAVGKKNVTLKKFLNQVLTLKWIVLGYSILVFLVITGSSIVVQFAHETLGKSETLSHRTVVWANCIEHFLKSPILGMGYMTTDQYVEKITLLRLGTNAHNMVLSILLTAGIIGMLIYIGIFYSALRRCGKKYSNCSLVLIIGVVTYLVVGLSSSALLFSAFAFLPHMLMSYQLDRK